MTKDNKKDVKSLRRSLKTFGPCYIDPKYLKLGFQYRLVLDEPGRLEMFERLGFRVVQREIPVGDKAPANSSPLGSAVTIRYKSDTPLVLMEISQDMFDEIEAAKREDVEASQQALTRIQGIPDEHTHGEIRLGSRK